MPRIPISDIPNAVPGPASMGLLSGQMPTIQAPNISGAAGMLKRDTLDARDYMGGAQAKAALGDALQNIGAMTLKVAKAEQQARDDVHILEADGQMERALADYQASIKPGSDSSTWASEWENAATKLQGSLSKTKGVSRKAQAVINARFQRFAGRAYLDLRVSGQKETFRRSKQAHLSLMERYVADGKTEDAKATVQDMVRKELELPEVGDELIHQIDIKGDEHQVKALISADPMKAVQLLDNNGPTIEINGRKQTPFKNLPVEKRLGLLETAKIETSQRQSGLVREFGQRIDQGERFTEENLRTLGGDYLTGTALKSLLHRQAKLARPDDAELIQLWQDVDEAAVSPSDGPVRHGTYARLRERIEKFPAAYVSNLSARLDEKYKGEDGAKPNAHVASFIRGTVRDWLKAGRLGKYDDDEPGHKKNDAVNLAAARLITSMETWNEEHPAATREEAIAELNSQLAKAQDHVGASRGKSSSQRNQGMFSPVIVGGSGRDVLKLHAKPRQETPGVQIGTKPEGQGKPLGKVTDYGQKDDPWRDSNSLKGLGAWNNKLHADSLAISPDIEEYFKELGIEQDDWVELTLSDGSKIRRQWSDRTATDKQARRLGLPPLRGRFDLFNPSGQHPLRDAVVVSVRKVEGQG